jgi:hypothetical protein
MSAILGLHQTGSNRHVIEATKTLAPIGMRVVGAPGQIDANALEESDAGCCNRGTSGAPGTFHHFGRPRKPNRTLIGLIQVATAKAANPVWVMRERQLSIGCGRRLKQFHLRQVLLDRRTQERVLPHGKSVLGREREHELVAVEGLHTVERINA